MSNIQIIRKEYSAPWQNIPDWVAEVPYLPPYGKATVVVDYIAYAAYIAPGSGQRVVNIRATSAAIPSNWNGAVGVSFLIEIPQDWENLGFRLGGGLKILVSEASNRYILLNATILGINANEALIRIDNIAAFAGQTPIEEQEDSIAFVQDFSSIPLSATLVRDGEEGSFLCPLSLQPPQVANPNSLPVTSMGSVGTWYVQVPWSVQGIPVTEMQAQIDVYHFLPIQTQTDLQRFTPQTNIYTNTLYLLLGIDDKLFTKLKLKTSQINCWGNNTSLGYSPTTLTLSGGNYVVSVASGSYTTLDTYIAVHNDTAAHTAALSSAAQLVQTQSSPAPQSLLSIVPPNPRVVGVAVLQSPSGEFGAYVSNTLSLRPPRGDKYSIEVSTFPNATAPWDALLIELKRTPNFAHSSYYLQHDLRSIRYFTVFVDMFNQEYLLEEAQYTFASPVLYINQMIDVTPLLHYPKLFGTYSDIDLLPFVKKKFVIIILSYIAKYVYRKTTLVPDNDLIPSLSGLGLGRLRIGMLIEDSDGVWYVQKDTNIDSATFTNLGTWVVSGNKLIWKYNPPTNSDTPASFQYRCAVFANDFSQTPLFQEDNTHPDNRIDAYTTLGRYEVSFDIPTDPGKYIFFVRMFIESPINQNFAEYYVLEVPAAPPTPPAGVSECPPCVPATEPLPKLVPTAIPELENQQPAGDWVQGLLPIGVCPSAWLCGLVQGEPTPEWLDVILYFNNRVGGQWVEGQHVVRVQGVIRRSDDEYVEERYTSKRYTEESLLRGYRRRYELELFIPFPCLLWEVELIKFAKRVDVLSRLGMIRTYENLIAEEFSVSDLQTAYRVRITLREELLRTEHRYK